MGGCRTSTRVCTLTSIRVGADTRRRHVRKPDSMSLTGSKRGREDAILSAMSKIVTLCTMEPTFITPPDFINFASMGAHMEEERRLEENAEAERLHKQQKSLLASEIVDMITEMKKQNEEEDAPPAAAYRNAVATDDDQPPQYRNAVAVDTEAAGSPVYK